MAGLNWDWGDEAMRKHLLGQASGLPQSPHEPTGALPRTPDDAAQITGAIHGLAALRSGNAADPDLALKQ